VLAAGAWDERPALRDRIAGAALERSGAAAVLGDGWAADVARGFCAGEASATETALRAAGVAAYRDVIAELRGGA